MGEIVWIPGATSLAVFVLLTLWCHGPLSPFLPAAYEPVLMAYGQLFPPLLVTVVGALCSTAVELLNCRYPFLTVWFCALSPLPDWAARILASHSGYSVRRCSTAVSWLSCRGSGYSCRFPNNRRLR